MINGKIILDGPVRLVQKEDGSFVYGAMTKDGLEMLTEMAKDFHDTNKYRVKRLLDGMVYLIISK